MWSIRASHYNQKQAFAFKFDGSPCKYQRLLSKGRTDFCPALWLKQHYVNIWVFWQCSSQVAETLHTTENSNAKLMYSAPETMTPGGNMLPAKPPAKWADLTYDQNKIKQPNSKQVEQHQIHHLAVD